VVSVAYFSMEIGVLAEMPTYAGGLGVLAGDTLRSAADIGVSMVGVTLLHRKGYFHQRLDAVGRQTEAAEPWDIQQFLTEQPQRATVAIEGRQVHLRCWRHVVKGTEGEVPVYFLDADDRLLHRWKARSDEIQDVAESLVREVEARVPLVPRDRQ